MAPTATCLTSFLDEVRQENGFWRGEDRANGRAFHVTKLSLIFYLFDEGFDQMHSHQHIHALEQLSDTHFHPKMTDVK